MKSSLLLWDTSLALSGVALLALAILLAARVLGARRANRRDELRQSTMRFLLSGEDAPASNSALKRVIAAEVTLELAELVRGSDRDRLLVNAARLGVPEALARQLRSARAQDRLTAAEGLAVFPPPTGEQVLAALDDRNSAVRLGAALALAHNHIAPPAGELVRCLGLGTRERSLLMVSLMRDLVDTDLAGVEGLLAAADLPDEVKLAATDALAAAGTVEHGPLVAWMATAATAETDLQPRLYRALGRLGHPGGREAILKGLRSPSWQVRAAAAEAAGTIGLADAVADLGGLLGDEQWWTRFRAGQALTRLGKAGIETLEGVAAGGAPVARHSASAILAERHSA